MLSSQSSKKNEPRDKSKDTCNNCGKKGHWARDCKQPKKNKGEGKRGSVRTGKWASPKADEAKIKKIDGKKKYLCSKCNC